jgi:hypothetical protein
MSRYQREDAHRERSELGHQRTCRCSRTKVPFCLRKQTFQRVLAGVCFGPKPEHSVPPESGQF